jgi:hypothetical protein
MIATSLVHWRADLPSNFRPIVECAYARCLLRRCLAIDIILACRLFVEDDILEMTVRLWADTPLTFHGCARMFPMTRHSYDRPFACPIL